jgi:catechol 2,3-dioxygenase-like lactoylglutathione lyase family enzyme
MALTLLRPMLEVDDITATIRFWTDILGFTVTDQINSDANGPPVWCNLSREDVSIMFIWQPEHSHDDGSTHRSQANLGGSLYFNTDDVDQVFAELGAKDGVGPIDGPADQPHGMREVHVVDPNGFDIYFGQPL